MNNNLIKNTLLHLALAIALSTLVAGCSMPNAGNQANDGTKAIAPVSVADPTQSEGAVKAMITSPADGSTLVPVSGFVEIAGVTTPLGGVNFVAGFKNPEKWRMGEEEGTLSLEPVRADGKGGFLVRIEESMIPEGGVYFAVFASPGPEGVGASKYDAAIVKVFHGASSDAADLTMADEANTSVAYYLLGKPDGRPNFCDGENMDSAGYKAALTKRIAKIVPGRLTTEEKIRTTLRLAVAGSGSFGENYALTANTTFGNGIVTMHSASGWAGSSIFYCAWKPFVERNLEQFPEVKEIKWGSVEAGAVIPSPDEASNWPTYTNPTYGYSIEYPSTWTERQSEEFEEGMGEEAKALAKVKDLNIEFYDGATLRLRIATDFITGGGDSSPQALASEVPAPQDKTTISGVVAYKMGGFDGYRRLVTVSDPVSQGLQYITTNKYDHTYFMSTFEKGESAEIVDMLRTFAIQLRK